MRPTRRQAGTSSCWSPDGKSIYAVREVGREDSDVYRIDVSNGKAENLTAHKGKELVSASDISPDGKTLLLSSNRKGGYDNVALFDLPSKKWRWVTDTQWTARPGEFSPDGKTFTYGINADGRTTIFFADTATLKASDRGVPPGINNVAASPNVVHLRWQLSSQPRRLHTSRESVYVASGR